MKYTHRILQIIICCGLSIAIAGCFSSTYVKRNQYLLNPQTFSIKQTKTHKYSVIVNSVSVTAPFNQLSFIYRVSDHQYLTDYYHTFATPLSQQFDSLLLNYSYSLGNFTPITIYNELSNADYKLQPTITYFYADYRDRDHPRAVVALNLKLFKHEDKQIKMLMNKTFIAHIPIKVKDTENLLAAWQQGLENVTFQGIRDLNKIFTK